jgi:hypothetical protein
MKPKRARERKENERAKPRERCPRRPSWSLSASLLEPGTTTQEPPNPVSRLPGRTQNRPLHLSQSFPLWLSSLLRSLSSPLSPSLRSSSLFFILSLAPPLPLANKAFLSLQPHLILSRACPHARVWRLMMVGNARNAVTIVGWLVRRRSGESSRRRIRRRPHGGLWAVGCVRWLLLCPAPRSSSPP